MSGSKINTHKLLKDIAKREIDQLDEFQAVATQQGPLTCNRVIANPGSGKTRTLITRTLHLHIDHEVPLDHITLITFTRKSAGEIEERFKKLLLEVISEDDLEHIKLPRISTVNAYGYRVLKNYTDFRNPRTLTPWQSYDMMEKIAKEVVPDLKGNSQENKEAINKICHEYRRIYSRNELNNFFSILFNPNGSINKIEPYGSNRYKDILDSDWFRLNRLHSAGVLEYPESEWDHLQSDYQYGVEMVKNCVYDIPKIVGKELKEIYYNYNVAKMEQNKIDFSDQSMYPFLLLSQYPEILERVRKRHQVCVVDEAQDIDHCQWALLYLIYCHEKEPTLTLIGDPKQTLYGFRNATAEFITRMDRLVEGDVNTQHIVSNYRSPKLLVDITNEFASYFSTYDIESKPSHCVAPDVQDKSLYVKEFETVEQEIEHIMDDIERLKNDKEVDYSNIVILARRNFQIELLEPELILRMIPYVMQKNTDEEQNKSAFRFIYDLLFLLKGEDNFDILMGCMEYIYGIGNSWIENVREVLEDSEDIKDFDDILKRWKQRSSQKDIKMFRMIHTIKALRQNAKYIDNVEDVIDIVIDTLKQGFQFKSDTNRQKKDGGRLAISLDELSQVYRTFIKVYRNLKKQIDFKSLSQEEQFDRFIEILGVTQGKSVEFDGVDQDGRLLVSTIHGFKGREADYVYHYHVHPIGSFRDEFSELCAFYVGCTRAKKRMSLTANKRSFTQKFQMKDTQRNKYLDLFYNATHKIIEQRKSLVENRG